MSDNWWECYCGKRIRLAPSRVDWIDDTGGFECYPENHDEFPAYHEPMRRWTEELVEVSDE